MVAATVAFAGGDAWPVVDIEIIVAKTLALFGCLLAALTFRRWHYLHRAWRWNAASFALLLERDALFRRGFLDGLVQAAADWIQAGLVLGANLCGVAGVWMLSRAWRIADLDLPGGQRVHRAVGALALVIAVAITAPSMSLHVRELAGGRVISLVGVASNLGDALTLALIAPVLLTALALRGQPVGWPWMLFTLAALAWLAYDATIVLSDFTDTNVELRRTVAEMFHAAGCGAIAAAGIAQRLSAAKAPAWTVGIAR
jgi:hypothetical protein